MGLPLPQMFHISATIQVTTYAPTERVVVRLALDLSRDPGNDGSVGRRRCKEAKVTNGLPLIVAAVACSGICRLHLVS